MQLTIAYAQKEITVEEVTPEIEEMMDLHGDRCVVVVRGLVHLEDTRCFEYTESIHRLDKFRFVEFARRRKVQAIITMSRMFASDTFVVMIKRKRRRF